MRLRRRYGRGRPVRRRGRAGRRRMGSSRRRRGRSTRPLRIGYRF